MLGQSKSKSILFQVFINHFWLNQTLSESVAAKRLHHQLMPMEINFESGFNAEIIDELSKRGHNTNEVINEQWFTTVTAISRARGYVEAVFDPRVGGGAEIN